MIHARSACIIRSLLSGLKRRRGRPSAQAFRGTVRGGRSALRAFGPLPTMNVQNIKTIHASPQTSGSLRSLPSQGERGLKPAQSAGKAERPSRSCAEKPKARMRRRRLRPRNRSSLLRKLVLCRPGGWSEEHKTRSHLELGR